MQVDLCLVPEVPVVTQGEKGCLPHLERVLAEKGSAVVVVAEGAGEEILGKSAQLDAGGNRKLPELGLWLKDQITSHFKEQGKPVTVKYIDPSYMIRSVPANASDSIYCELLAQNVVHGAMVRRAAPRPRGATLSAAALLCTAAANSGELGAGAHKREWVRGPGGRCGVRTTRRQQFRVDGRNATLHRCPSITCSAFSPQQRH